MANPSGIISTQDLADLFRSYITAFGPMAEAPDPIEEQIARVIPGEGQAWRIPLAPVANVAGKHNLGDERGFQGMEEYFVEGKHVPIYPASTRVPFDVIMSSRLQFQLFSDQLNEMLMTAPAIWRELLAETMDNARVAHTGANASPQLRSYNGSFFFSTTHPVDPNDAAKLTQSNYLKNTKIDKAGAVAAFRLLDNMKGHNGQRINRRSRNLVLVVPNRDVYVRAAEVFTAEMIAQAVGANAAVAIKNQVASVGVRILLFPELSDWSDKASYLLDLTSPTARAFIMSKVRQVTPFMAGLVPEDEVRRKYLSIEAGYDAFGGAGVGLHQKAICIEEP